MIKKFFSAQTLLWASLLLALAGSLRHVANVFASVDGNVTWGWLQALAIDAGLLALALAISQRKRAGRKTRWLVLGVVIFCAISVYANLAYGLQESNGVLPNWVIVTKPYILAGVLPLLVVYLAEIVGSDVNFSLASADKERKKAEREDAKKVFGTTGFVSSPDTAAHARTARLNGKEQAKDSLLEYYSDNPNASYAEAGRHIQRSRQTVAGYISELEADGKLNRNGEGVLVTG